VADVERFLEGKNDGLAQELTTQMESAAEELKFEQAARLRDRVQALAHGEERQKIISTEDSDLTSWARAPAPDAVAQAARPART